MEKNADIDPYVGINLYSYLFALWDVKRKPQSMANAPPIDSFPTYNEQSGSGADNYIRGPDSPAEAYY